MFLLFFQNVDMTFERYILGNLKSYLLCVPKSVPAYVVLQMDFRIHPMKNLQNDLTILWNWASQEHIV